MKSLLENKKRLSLLVLVAALAAAIVAVALYYASDPYGFARKVSTQEAQERLSLVEAAQRYLGLSETDEAFPALLETYNTHEPLAQGYTVTLTDSWCAAFVSVCAIDSGLTELIPTECSCERQIEALSALGSFTENDDYMPLPGDLIYYSWDTHAYFSDNTDWASHVGIVVGTAGPVIKVIEGNKNDRVEYRYILHGDYRIRGYGMPAYAGTEETK